MKKLGRIFRQRVLTSMLILVAVSLLIGSVVEQVYAADSKNAADPTPLFFAPPPLPVTGRSDVIGLAADEYHLYFTTCDNDRSVWSFNSSPPTGGPNLVVQIHPSGSNPDPRPNAKGTCFEDYIALSPGENGWPPNHLYVTEGPNIYDIDLSAQPVTATLFATILFPPYVIDHVGINFDTTTTGVWGHDMILTGDNSGEVRRVSSPLTGGVQTFVTTITTPPPGPIGPVTIEGPTVMPTPSTITGIVGGSILVASATAGAVYAVPPPPPATVSTPVATWPAAEQVLVVPQNVGEFDSSNGGFFTSILSSGIWKLPPNAFNAIGGDILVTSQNSNTGIGILTPSSPTTFGPFQTPFGPPNQDHEGSTFVVKKPKFEYAAKFVCGNWTGPQNGTDPVAPATYWTAINIHNPNDTDATLSKKIALAQREGLPQNVSNKTGLILASDAAFEIDCMEIADLAKKSGITLGPFYKGFVVLNSPTELDVIGVYTSKFHESITLDTQTVTPKLITPPPPPKPTPTPRPTVPIPTVPPIPTITISPIPTITIPPIANENIGQ